MILQKEKEQQTERYEKTVQQLQAKHETDMSHLHQEHGLSAAKVHSTTTSNLLHLLFLKHDKKCFTKLTRTRFPFCFPVPGFWGDRRVGESDNSAQTTAAGQWTSEAPTTQGM